MTTASVCVLDDGRHVTIRPIRVQDREPLRAMHRRLSPVTVSRRFFVAYPELAARQAEHFVTVDGVDRVALVAETDEGALVGVARYDRLPGTADAEVALVVQDDYQHHRVGTSLLHRLGQLAQEGGITRFTADVLLENSAMFATFRDVGLVGTADYESGVAHLVLPLAGSGDPGGRGPSALTAAAGTPQGGD